MTLSRRQALEALVRGGAGAACAVLVTACGNGSSNTNIVGSIGSDPGANGTTPGRDAIKVALLLPLSGGPQTAAIAKGLQQAAELAIFERNTPDLQLLVKDDKGTEDGARAATEEAVREGAEIIVGPLFAKSVQAAAAVARPAGIPIIAFSNDGRVAGKGVYLLSFLASQEVPRIVSYTVAQGRTRFAALLPDDASGRVLEPLFQAAVRESGGTVLAVERYPVDINGMIEPVRKLREAVRGAHDAGTPVEALFLPGGADTLPLIGPLLPRTEFDGQSIKVIGVGGWDYPNAARERILQNGWFAAPDPRGWREFSERFAKTYKAMPPRLATLAYDAVGVAAAFASESKGSRYTATNLTRAAGFAGIDGPFRLLQSGLSERSLAILEMQKFGPSLIDPAAGTVGMPRAFAGFAHSGTN